VSSAEHIIGKVGHLGPKFAELEAILTRYSAARERQSRLRVHGHPIATTDTALTAAPGDIVPVDPTTGALTITLPKASADRIGAYVMVINVSGSTNTITVAPADGDEINGSVAGKTITTSWGYLRVVSYANEKWALVT
jgi:hypothetical protein